jgi:hypothetical protein
MRTEHRNEVPSDDRVERDVFRHRYPARNEPGPQRDEKRTEDDAPDDGENALRHAIDADSFSPIASMDSVISFTARTGRTAETIAVWSSERLETMDEATELRPRLHEPTVVMNGLRERSCFIQGFKYASIETRRAAVRPVNGPANTNHFIHGFTNRTNGAVRFIHGFNRVIGDRLPGRVERAGVCSPSSIED